MLEKKKVQIQDIFTTAKSVDLSYEQVFDLLAIIIATTIATTYPSAEVVGNAFKMLVTRIQTTNINIEIWKYDNG